MRGVDAAVNYSPSCVNFCAQLPDRNLNFSIVADWWVGNGAWGGIEKGKTRRDECIPAPNTPQDNQLTTQLFVQRYFEFCL